MKSLFRQHIDISPTNVLCSKTPLTIYISYGYRAPDVVKKPIQVYFLDLLKFRSSRWSGENTLAHIAMLCRNIYLVIKFTSKCVNLWITFQELTWFHFIQYQFCCILDGYYDISQCCDCLHTPAIWACKRPILGIQSIIQLQHCMSFWASLYLDEC